MCVLFSPPGHTCSYEAGLTGLRLPSWSLAPPSARLHANLSIRESRRQNILKPVGLPVSAQGQAGTCRQGRGRGAGERSPGRA